MPRDANLVIHRLVNGQTRRVRFNARHRESTSDHLSPTLDHAASSPVVFSTGLPSLSKADIPLPADPVVLVSLPVFNTPVDLFERALSSILSQSGVAVAVLVSFDGGDDELLRNSDLLRDPRVVTHSYSANHGPYFCHHVALLSSPAPFFAIQDSDDFSAPNRFALLEAALRSLRADAAFPSVVEHFGDRCAETAMNAPSSEEVSTRTTIRHVADHFGLYRSDFLRQLGYYFGTRMGADTLLVNMTIRYGRCIAVPQAKYHRCHREDSLTRASATGYQSAARVQAISDLQQTWNAVRSVEDARTVCQTLEHTRNAAASAIQCAVSCLKDRVLWAVEEAQQNASAISAGEAPVSPELEQLDLVLSHAEFSDWSISRKCACALFDHLMVERPVSVVDFGSGVTSLVFGAYAKVLREQSGTTVRVLSLDHDAIHLARTKTAIETAGLSRYVALVHAPLADATRYQIRHATYQFDFAMLAPFDFVFVDGPPGSVGRHGTLPSVVEHLAETWTCWLHDGFRADERSIVAQWSKLLPRKFRFQITGEYDARGVTVLEGV